MRQNENNQLMKVLPKLNYSEKLFLSRNQEKKKKIDIAFNSISDTNNQQQISYALKQVNNISERKQLISKIIKRKKEIEDMQEINTINSLAPLFSKIKQKFFNNLYKKTGNKNHLLLSQGKDPYSNQQSFQSSTSLSNEPQEKEKQEKINEETKQPNSSLNLQMTSPLGSPTNSDQKSFIKRQTHLLSALTFLSIRSKSNQNKQKRLSIRQSYDNTYISEGGNALKYLTKDPYIFKADLNFSKDQKKQMQKSNSQDIKIMNDQLIESDSTTQKDKLKKIKSKVEHYKQKSKLKKEILTNHTSLKKLINYSDQNHQNNNPKILLIDDYSDKQKQSDHYYINCQNDEKAGYLRHKENGNDNFIYFQGQKSSPSNQKNSIFKSQFLEMNEKNFSYENNFSNYIEHNKKSRNHLESQISQEYDLNSKNSNQQNNKNILFKDTPQLDEKDYIKGLPKLNNFGGSYYYLGKKLPESYLYRYIIQCEQKRLYLKSDGQLFSNQPFTEQLDKINKVSHIHKIFENDKKQLNIFQLKHNEEFASFPKSSRNYFSLSKQSSKNSLHKQNQSSQPKTNSFMTQRKYSDTSTNNSAKGYQILNNTKDTDSILSFQIPDNLKPHVIKGFYSPKQKLNIDDKIQKQYFVKVNYQL
ncbi:hypothetical protein TTHERM_01107410 (macronuclear) [Tetrahymena thermophila SB210]|uniref:Uncharacterized protein n=1 Tax=Tetrahymena thermophila (strain SB210) TaxID=312017 RepID=Q22BB5_TETTS|nr:hypothetical protein TTHERM_01107410 [Tetrahymena thermophila SB210]EAR82593.2 hypothetical protein TTHERM_01107410 [Tetrahymena thermophila SB210]|eukprot:XP_001030256.2 hypothetical protein TTHERM_01107410 [Tetrahymena thermophila SB210]